MRKGIWIVAGVALVGAMAFAWIRWTHRGPGVWTTDSPAEQGGLRLMAIQPNQPSDWSVISSSKSVTDLGFQTAWFEIMPQVRHDEKSRLQFHMVDRDGNDELLWEVDDGIADTKDRRFASVDIPLCYGPEFVGSTLEAYLKGKRIGAWKLSGMPLLPKQISDDEPDVLSAEALGYRFTADAPFRALYWVRNGRRTQYSLQAHVKIAPTGDDDGKDQMEVLTGATRTTWGRDSSGHSITDPRVRNLAGVGTGLPFTSSTRRAELTLTVRRYRTMDEPIVFKNIQAKYSDVEGDRRSGVFNGWVDTPQSVKTPSGLTITLPTSERLGYWQKDSVCFRLQCPQGSTDLVLPDSPLYRATKKPVSIEFAFPDGKSVSGSTDNMNKGNWTVAYKIPGPRRSSPFLIPELKLIVRQKVVLEEKIVKIIAPVVPEQDKAQAAR